VAGVPLNSCATSRMEHPLAHNRGSFRRGISESQRRKKLWVAINTLPIQGEDLAGSSLNPPTIVAAGSSVDILEFGTDLNPTFAESTILRIRGYISIPKSSVTQTAAFSDVFAFGIGIVSTTAALQGAVPNPAENSGASWDGWMFLRSSTELAVDVTGTMLDVKAQRKWKSGDSLVFVAGAATSNTSGLAQGFFFGGFRGLFLLP